MIYKKYKLIMVSLKGQNQEDPKKLIKNPNPPDEKGSPAFWEFAENDSSMIGEGYHLYVVSDKGNIFQLNNFLVLNNNLKKIIATTDRSLGLPLIPNLYIKKFVEEYNKENKIEEIFVGYEEDKGEIKLKLHANNKINIKPEIF